MRNSVFLAVAVLALGACNGANDADRQADAADTAAAANAEGIDPQADAGFEAVAPGNYEVVRADGTIDQLTILPGMTWAMVFANGEPAGGTIFAQGGKNCFVTEGVAEQQCFTGSDLAEDGSMQVTAPEGEVMTVRPVDSFE